MARLDFNLNPEGGSLISFHFEYQDYLDDIGCIDSKTAKEMKAKQKRQTDQ